MDLDMWLYGKTFPDCFTQDHFVCIFALLDFPRKI